jgi:hypothetical protein
MSMELVVDLLSATVRSADAERARRASAVLERVAAGGLETALRSVSMPAGEWYVQRHMVPLVVETEEADSLMAANWAHALVASIAAALRTGGKGIVRYDNDTETAIDAVAGIAAGRLDRVWAWRQAGVLETTRPDPVREPGPAIVAILGVRSELAAKILSASALRASLVCLDRALGDAGWRAAAQVVSGTRDAASSVGADELMPDVRRALARRLVRASTLASLIVRNGVRPSAPTLRAWGELVAEEVDPVAARRKGVRAAVVAELRRGLAHAEPAAPSPLVRSSQTDHDRIQGTRTKRGETVTVVGLPEPGRFSEGTSSAEGISFAEGTSSAGETMARMAVPTAVSPTRAGASSAERNQARADWDDDRGEQPEATRHGGLFFFLATASAAGVPRDATRGVLAGRPMPWVVHQSMQRMAALEAADPALLGVAGLDRRRGQWLLSAEPANAPEEEQLGAITARWSESTLQRLADARANWAAPAHDLHWLVDRPAAVLARPGWVEVIFSAQLADSLVRRAGLDLDPGWVPWLGCVVRYRYE